MEEKFTQHTQQTESVTNQHTATQNDSNESNTKNCSVYVGDLPFKTVESDLYKIFNSVGSILTIKLIKPQNENYSNYNSAYAYIIFNQQSEAEEAVAKLNFYKLHDKEIRVMFYDKENLKKSTGGNIVIKNLSPECDCKTLHDTFSIFGEILSCKVAQNTQGQCKGFGFVQFKKKSSAKKAIKLGSEMQMDGFNIKVEKYEKNYKTKTNVPNFTNIFFKNFPLEKSEEDLKKIFEEHGEVTSFHFSTKSDGNLRGFGFANFKNTEDAQNAIEKLHNKNIFGNEYPEPFYVQQAQKKQQRVDLLSAAFEKLSMNGLTYKRNLYVTKLPANYDQEKVTDLFATFGKVISVIVGKDNILNEEKNWAYVCFSSADEASLAIEKGNNLTIQDSKISISYFKNKNERQTEYLNENIQRYAFKNTYNNNMRGNSLGAGIGGRPTPFLYKKADNLRYQQRKPLDKKHMLGDLHGLVLSLAPSFSEKWHLMGITNNEEFAKKVTDNLMKKPTTDLRNMIALGNVLTENIDAIFDNVEDEKDFFSKKNNN